MKFFFTCLLAFLLLPFSGKTQTPGDEDRIFITVEQAPVFKGGYDSLMWYLVNNIRYPQEAQKNGDEGVVYIAFVIDSLGRIKSPEVVKSVSPSLDAEGLRMVTNMPAWEPGKQMGRPVSVTYTLPIRFVIKSKPQKIRPARNFPAKFPGGEEAMNAYFAANLKYPPIALKNNSAGTVVVGFKILKDGQVTGFKIEKSVSPELDAEALRVLQAMPTWEPAHKNGKPYTTKMMLDIPFVLPPMPAPVNKARVEEFDPITGKMVKKPQFLGGEEAMMRFLATHIKYPIDAQRNGLEGEVTLLFLVDATGMIRNIRILNSFAPSLEAEAIRVVKMMPRWLPGETEGRPADMEFTLPIRFAIR